MRILIRSACFLLIACFLSCNIKPEIRSNEGSLESKSESAEEAIPSEQAVDFEGVSFTYDPRVFGDVKKEVVPEVKLKEPDEKPDEVAPQHIRFEFEFGREYSKARIAVFPLEGFEDVYGVSPDSVANMKEYIAGLRKVVNDSSFRVDGQIPHLEFRDASDNFYVKVRDFDFPSGDGVLFVTHWEHGVDFVTNRNLLYRFEGITADGKYYVTAQAPVSVAFLPDDSPREFEGFTEEDLMEFMRNSKVAVAKHKKYIESISTRLEKLTSSDFSPNLEKFEAIISSLKIKGQNRER
jgi:hypothetical protein